LNLFQVIENNYKREFPGHIEALLPDKKEKRLLAKLGLFFKPYGSDDSSKDTKILSLSR